MRIGTLLKHALMRPFLICLISCFLFEHCILAQAPSTTTYPKATGYISVVHSIVTLDKNGSSFNFADAYTVGFPFGVNILKSDRIGYSMEVTPFIKSTPGLTRTSNVLFHPGIIFRYPHAFNLVTRLAFETSGRFGGTVVFNKVFYRTAMNSYWFSVPLPLRFGNGAPASIGIGIQLGITF